MGTMLNATTKQQFDSAILPRLRSLGRRLRLYTLLDGLAVLLPAIVLALLLTLLVDHTLRLDRDIRAGQLFSGLLAIGLIAWRWLWAPLRVRVGDTDLAVLVERKFPQLESRLISAIEFTGPGAASAHAAHSVALMDTVVGEAGRRAAELRFEDALAHRRARHRAMISIGCVAFLAVLSVAAGPTLALWFKRNVLLSSVEWPQQNRLVVTGLTDGKILAARGDDVSVSADVVAGYDVPRQVYIEYRTVLDARGTTGPSQRQQMPAVTAQAADAGARASTSFTHTFERIEDTLQCRVTGGDARTDWFTVEVVDRPRIEEVTIEIFPPAYTRLDPYPLRAGQTVAEALKGSRLRFHIRTNKPVVKAELIREAAAGPEPLGPASAPAPTSPYSGARQAFTAEDAPAATASYYFLMEDELGLSSVSDRSPPLRFSVRLLPDKPPGVKIRIRGVGEMITPQAILPIETDFSDAYGLATAELVHDLGRKDSKPVVAPVEGFEPGRKAFIQIVDWSAAKFQAAEGDRVTLKAQAKDFDNISGPNLGESPAITLRVVSREELLAELNRREQEYRQDFERLIRSQEELYAEALTLSRPLKAGSSAQDRLRSFGLLARRQRDHASRLNSIRMQFEQVMSELQTNQLSSPTVESRLGGGIIQPIGTLLRNQVPKAADNLDALAREVTPQALQAAKLSQDAILAEMNRILANMQKWEGFQEAVGLLREVLKMQGNLNQEIEQRVEEEVFGPSGTGTRPATAPSK
jgi:hypothetical protein